MRIITTDGRLFEGKLELYDHSSNVLISNTNECLVYPDGENQVIPLGGYLLRGDTVVCVGECEGAVDWMAIKGNLLKTTKNPL